MRVALSLRIVNAVDYDEARDALSHDWVSWTEAHGWTPLLISNALRDPGAYLREMAVDLLVLTGGNDSVPADPANTDHEPLRDQCEFSLIRSAIEARLPILGVCRGMHMINRYFGGQVVPALTAGDVNHVAAVHPVSLAGAVAEATGDVHIETNSYHNQGVRPDGLGKNVTAFAFSDGDGLVEGLVHDALPILATQWHPERHNPATAVDDRLIGRLVEEGTFWAAA